MKKNQELMDRDSIKQSMAESGKITITQLMSYMAAKYKGKYNVKLAKECAKEILENLRID